MWGIPQLGSSEDTYVDRVLTQVPETSQGKTGSTNVSWLPAKRWTCQHTESRQAGTFRL